MRYVTVLAALNWTLCVSAFGDITDDGFIDPNVGFCNAPASSACGADPNLLTSTTSFGMWDFGKAGEGSTKWYLLVSVPEAIKGTASAPTITSPDFTLTLQLPDPSAYLYSNTAANAVHNIYDLTKSVTGLTNGNNSMSDKNMFNSLEKTYFGGTMPTDFAVFVYKASAGFDPQTAYQFQVSDDGLAEGTYLAAIGIGGKKNNIGFSTPYTTAGLADTPSVPDGGMTFAVVDRRTGCPGEPPSQVRHGIPQIGNASKTGGPAPWLSPPIGAQLH